MQIYNEAEHTSDCHGTVYKSDDKNNNKDKTSA